MGKFVLVFELQNLKQGYTTDEELIDKISTLPKDDYLEVLDCLRYLAEFDLIRQIINSAEKRIQQ